MFRLAAYYAALGIGEFYPEGYGNFNKVVVRELMPWNADALTTILIVEFFQGSKRERYVEFSLTVAGFGGAAPVVRLVP